MPIDCGFVLLAMSMYVAYILVMLAILGLMAGIIAGLNFGIRVAKKFMHGDWRYGRKVLLALAVFGIVFLCLAGDAAYHIINDPPE